MTDRSIPALSAMGDVVTTAARPHEVGLEAALRRSEERLAAIVDSVDQMIWSARPDGFHDYYNARWYEFTGLTPGSTDGWNGMFHPEDQERARSRWRHSLSTGEPYHIEYRLRHHTGTYRWVIGRAQPVRDEVGHITRWYGTCTDVHDLKMAEEARDLIAQELAHRIKNTFALVSGLVAMSAREDPAAKPFADAVQARIMALSRAQEFVRPTGTSSGERGQPSLLGLIGVLLAPYRSEGQERVRVQGDDVAIGSDAATALSLILHELSTNAVKHGAFATAQGYVVVACERSDDAMTVTWHERGGVLVEAPSEHRGFGLGMSERVARMQLGADLVHAWDREGLVARIVMPVVRLAG